MAKAPRAGRVKTRLVPACAPEFVVELYRAFIEDTIALGRTIGAAIAVVCPPADAADITAWLPSSVRVTTQHGEGLADGLTSAFEILCTPTSRVIAFNGDSPHLPAAELESAFGALDAHDLVIGPCEDGGYYLVGAARAHSGLFDPRGMGTGSALNELIARSRQLGLTSAVTAQQYDVDMPADLARLARELQAQPQRAPRTAALLKQWLPEASSPRAV